MVLTTRTLTYLVEYSCLLQEKGEISVEYQADW